MADSTGYTIRLAGIPGEFRCGPGQSLLGAMEGNGIREIPIGCRGGGCGLCRIRVDRGDYKVGKMSQAKVSNEELGQGFALACRVFPRSDMTIEVKVMDVQNRVTVNIDGRF